MQNFVAVDDMVEAYVHRSAGKQLAPRVPLNGNRNRSATYDLLLVIYSNHESISYRFRVLHFVYVFSNSSLCI